MPQGQSTIVGPIRSPEGQLAFPHLMLPETTGKFPSNKFVTTFLMPATTSVAELVAACLLTAQKEWPALGITQARQIKLPLRKGADKPGWEGFIFFKAKSKNKPPLLDARKQVWTGTPKAGDFCKLAVSAMAYKQQVDPEIVPALQAAGILISTGVDENNRPMSWRPATTFLLNGVQWLRAGQPIGGQGAVDGTAAFQEEAPPAAAGALNDDLFT